MKKFMPRLRQQGETPLTGLAVARRLLDANKLEQALTQIDKSLRGNPEFADAHALKGIVLERMDDLNGAAGCFELETRLNPEDPNGWLRLGRVLMKRGFFEDALAATSRAIFLERNPPQESSDRAYILRAQILQKQCKTREAVKAYILALKREPNRAESNLWLGKLLVEKGAVNRGIQHLETATRLSPDDPAPLISLGDAWRVKRNLDQAIKHYMSAQRLAPCDSAIYIRLGDMYIEHDLPGEALGLFRVATMLDSKNAHCFMQLGVIYLAERRYEEAIEMLRRACRLDPNLVYATDLLNQARSALSRSRAASAKTVRIEYSG